MNASDPGTSDSADPDADAVEPGAAPARAGRRPNPAQARHRARRFAVQALYQAQVNPIQPLDLVAQFRGDNEFVTADEDYFTAAVTTVMRRREEYDGLFSPLLDRTLEELDPVERAILRLATWELRERIDVPYRVVIDQAVNLAKVYGASESHRFVNGVLDKLARSLRGAEFGAARG
ncbi:MAG TPA: transcription antitermination factor NusB [Pseudomonadales bacterium]|nr:transcription antitermination factor NusB [Pseudomonadales bacterium]